MNFPPDSGSDALSVLKPVGTRSFQNERLTYMIKGPLFAASVVFNCENLADRLEFSLHIDAKLPLGRKWRFCIQSRTTPSGDLISHREAETKDSTAKVDLSAEEIDELGAPLTVAQIIFAISKRLEESTLGPISGQVLAGRKASEILIESAGAHLYRAEFWRREQRRSEAKAFEFVWDPQRGVISEISMSFPPFGKILARFDSVSRT